jgi:simple sugar transport system permease protein
MTARRFHLSGALWPLLALSALILFNLLFTRGFADLRLEQGRLYGALVDIPRGGALVVLLATGMTLVIASGGIDLSVGSVMALSGAVAALGITRWHLSPAQAVAAGLGTGAAAGAFNAALITRLGLQPIIATLVSLGAARGLAQYLTGDQKVRFSNDAVESLYLGSLGAIPVPIVLAAAAVAIIFLLTRKTTLGLYTEAIGDNPRAAFLCGLPVRSVLLGVYALSGLLAAGAGLIAAAEIKEADVAGSGLYLELDAILAVVIGGTPLMGGRPRLLGSALGALVMQTLTITLQMRNIPTEHALIVKGLVALGVCALQSPGAAALVGIWRPLAADGATVPPAAARRASVGTAPEERAS